MQIIAYILEGRTLDQKRLLVKNITNAVVESLGVKPEIVGIELIEQKTENIGRAGILVCDRK